jgi:phage tail tape-measure protein
MKAWGLILLPAVLLAGCGTDARDRTQGGAASGALAGAGIGALGGPVGVLVGGLIGGGAGALTGATVPPDSLNLGRPPWSNDETRPRL